MSKVTSLVTASSTVVADIRAFADDVEAGRKSVDHAMIIFRSRSDEYIGRVICGDTLSYSAMMGLLSYVSHMLFLEANNEL